MSNVPSDTPRSTLRKPMRASIDVGVIAKTASPAIVSHNEQHAFQLPARLFEQLPFAIYICDRNGLVLRFNRRAAELWGRSPKLGDPNERYCGSYRMYRPDGSLLLHHECPMADVLRTGVSVRAQEVHIGRPDGSRGIALVDIEAVKDSDGEIVAAVNCFQDITERKQAEEREKVLAREVDHRAKNLLALVQATVHLTHADTVENFKAAIEGRLQALSNAHALVAQSRWVGANLHTLVTEELAPYCPAGTSRANISGPELLLESKAAQTIAMVLHELTTNAVKYGALSVPSGRLRVEWSRSETDLVIRWSEADGPPVKPPSHQGFGTRIAGPVIQTDLGGKVRFDWNPAGLVCEIIIPLDHLAGTLSNANGMS
jgi:PAS domain S-box-containing protein